MSDCTILIPTFNRPRLFDRLLRYLDDHNVAYPIIVGDSSEPAIQECNAQACSRRSDIDIQIIHYPKDTNPFMKCADLSRHSTTDFTVFCADDDLLNPRILQPCIDFLRRHRDYVNCHGDYYGFKASHRTFYWKPIYDNHQVDADDNGIRAAVFLMSWYRPTFYDVHRTRPLKKTFDDVQWNIPDLPSYGELTFDILTALRGKLAYIHGFHMARAVDSKITYTPALIHTMYAMDPFYCAFMDYLGTQMDLDDLQTAFDEYLQTTRRHDAYRRHVNFVQRLHVPILLDEFVRSINPTYARFRTKDPDDGWSGEYRRVKDVVMRGKKPWER